MGKGQTEYIVFLVVLLGVGAALLGSIVSTHSCNAGSYPCTENQVHEVSLSNLTLREKIGQMVMTSATELNAEQLGKAGVGGILVGGRSSKAAYKGLIEAHQRNARIPLLVAADLEGNGCFGRDFVGLKTFMDPPQIETVEQARELGVEHGQLLRELGINTNFAPVVDLGDRVWTCRSYGTDAADVAAKVAAYTEGLQSQGIAATAKHWPGQTLNVADPHLQLVHVNITEADILPFRAAADAKVKVVMITHTISSGAVDSGGKPASISPEATSKLREFFNGTIVTDDMQMAGVKRYYFPSYNIGAPCDIGDTERAYVDAVKAGADIILEGLRGCGQKANIVIDAIAAAVDSGEISEKRIDESVRRILELKGIKVLD